MLKIKHDYIDSMTVTSDNLEKALGYCAQHDYEYRYQRKSGEGYVVNGEKTFDFERLLVEGALQLIQVRKWRLPQNNVNVLNLWVAGLPCDLESGRRYAEEVVKKTTGPYAEQVVARAIRLTFDIIMEELPWGTFMTIVDLIASESA